MRGARNTIERILGHAAGIMLLSTWARVNERDRAWSSVVERVERGVAAASVVRAWYERGYLGTARARIRVFERGDIV